MCEGRWGGMVVGEKGRRDRSMWREAVVGGEGWRGADVRGERQ